MPRKPKPTDPRKGFPTPEWTPNGPCVECGKDWTDPTHDLLSSKWGGHAYTPQPRSKRF